MLTAMSDDEYIARLEDELGGAQREIVRLGHAEARANRMRGLLGQAEELLLPETFGEDEGYVWEVVEGIRAVIEEHDAGNADGPG